MQYTKKEIESFISEFFKKKDGVKVLKKIKNINLIESGLIDSLDLVTLSLKLEIKFKIKVNPNSSLTLKKFSNFDTLIDYIYKKCK
ncbi:MAG: hypothetical protein CMM44_11630 [Rhodospirillaceae bacterium]|nr:hypothetical protein [Rhodospirillaceae bacterium]|tara:strand:- start:458 stop:715 length:258 start_codon:yes stop_codon:yes gene_type:complete